MDDSVFSLRPKSACYLRIISYCCFIRNGCFWRKLELPWESHSSCFGWKYHSNGAVAPPGDPKVLALGENITVREQVLPLGNP